MISCRDEVGSGGVEWGLLGVKVGVKTLNLSILFSFLLDRQQPAYDPENLYQIYDVIISIDLVQSMQIEEKPSPK